MGVTARNIQRRNAASIKRALRLWVLNIAGRMNEAVWSYDAEAEKRADRAMWVLFWVAITAVALDLLGHAVSINIFGA